MDPLTQIRLTRDARRHRFHDAARNRRPASSSPHASAARLRRRASSRSSTVASTSSRRLGRPDVVLSTHFDCVPPFFPSREAGRAAVRTRRLRREGHSGRADCRGRAAPRGRASRASGCCSSSAKSGAARAPRRRTRSPPGSRFLDQRRADRQPPGDGDARRLSRAAARDRQGRALEPAGPGRVGDRQARGRARRAARRRLAGRSGPGHDVLHGRSHQRRHRAQCDLARRRGRDDVPDRRRPRGAAPADRNAPPARSSRSTTCSSCRPCGSRRVRASTPQSSRSRRTFRFSIAGARRSCSARDRSRSRTPTTSTSRSPSSTGRSSCTSSCVGLLARLQSRSST